MKIELKYRTFDDVLSEVSLDLHSWDVEGLIEPAQLIKVARKVNKDLGLSIHTTKEVILDIEHNVARLPDDFYVLNLALLCGRHRVVKPELPSGTHREDLIVPWPTPVLPSDCPCMRVQNTSNSIVQATVQYCNGTSGSIVVPPGTDTTVCARSVTGYPSGILTTTSSSFCYEVSGEFACTPPVVNCNVPAFNSCNPDPDPMGQRSVKSVCCGSNIQVIEQKRNCPESFVYEEFEKIQVEPSSLVDTSCMNTRLRHRNTAQLKNGHIYTNITQGKLFISYQGMLEDDQGNLLVLDHEIINEYYEYAFKERILENLLMNGETGVEARYKLMEDKLQKARRAALGIVNMPNFQDMLKVWKLNRQSKYNRYYKPFEPLVM